MKRGSVSVFLTLLLPAVILVSLILAEYSQACFLRVKARADQYLAMDQALSDFDRKLFSEMGILGVKHLASEAYGDPLSERAMLEKSILRLMDERLLLLGVNRAEQLLQEFLSNKLNLEISIFDVNALNRDLTKILDGLWSEKEIEVEVSAFLARLVATRPYVELKGMGWHALLEDLKQLRLDAIRERRPYFSLRPYILESYDKILNYAKKLDALGLIERFQLADYGVDYLGYSMTQEEKESLHTEYLLTGYSSKEDQKFWIRMELFGLRMLLNFSEILTNPSLRDKVLKLSGGNPALFGVEALGLAAGEAWLDVKGIFERKPIPLYKGRAGFQIFGATHYGGGWVYPDYLKLLLMMLPRNIYLKRMGEAIEHNYDLDLDRVYTSVKFHWIWSFKGKIIPFILREEMKGGLSVLETGLSQLGSEP